MAEAEVLVLDLARLTTADALDQSRRRFAIESLSVAGAVVALVVARLDPNSGDVGHINAVTLTRHVFELCVFAANLFDDDI